MKKWTTILSCQWSKMSVPPGYSDSQGQRVTVTPHSG